MRYVIPFIVFITLSLTLWARPALAQDPPAPAESAAPEAAPAPATAGSAETALAGTTEEPETAAAEEPEAEEEDRVVVGDSLVIEADDVVPGDAVCIGGDLTVKGTVGGDAVSIGGHLKVTPTAVIGGDAVTIGGTADIAPGATVGGEKVTVEGEIPGLKSIKWLGLLGKATSDLVDRIVAFVKEVVFFGFLMFVALLMTVFMKRQFGNIEEHLKAEFPRAALIGVAALILLPLACLFLTISILGIPLVPLVMLATIICMVVGYVALARVLGARLVGERHVMFQIFIGLLLVHGAALAGDLVSLPGGMFATIGGVLVGLGWIIFIGGGLIGLGAVVYSQFGRRTLAETVTARETREARKNGGAPPPATPA